MRRAVNRRTRDLGLIVPPVFIAGGRRLVVWATIPRPPPAFIVLGPIPA